MTNADTMFEELGYKKKGNNDHFEYNKLDNKVNELYTISFLQNSNEKTISCRLYTQGGKYGGFPLAIEPQELKAINEKCKELGWLDD